MGKAERVYEVLPGESKSSYAKATKALGDRLEQAGRKAQFGYTVQTWPAEHKLVAAIEGSIMEGVEG